MRLVGRLLAGEQGPRADGVQKRVGRVGEAREPRELGHRTRRAHALEVAAQGRMRAQELRLGHNVEVLALRKQQVELAEELHARGELAGRLARALGDGAALAAVLLEQGEDEVALPQLRAVDDDGLGMPGAAPCHGYSVAS